MREVQEIVVLTVEPEEHQERGRRKPSTRDGRKVRGGFPKWLLVVPALLLAGAGWLLFANLYTDWLWYSQLGYAQVFSTSLSTKLLTAAVLGGAALAFLYFNFRLALRLSPAPPDARRYFDLDGQRVPVRELASAVKALTLPTACIVALVFAIIGWSSWDTVLRFLYGVPFGASDPIFGRDVAFYVFTLPVLEAALHLSEALVILSFIGACLIYLSRAVEGQRMRALVTLPRPARAHLLALVALFALLLACGAYLAVPNLIFSPGGAVAGASYTDIAASLPALWMQLFVALLVAALAVVTIFRRNSRLLWAGVGAYILVAIIGGWVYPGIVQRFSVAPNELAKESPYIEHNIRVTRVAFNLERVEEREVSGEQVLNASDIAENQRTINNIRLWDQQPLLDTFAQIQEIRTYYEFNSVDNDRYTINGEAQQVMLSPRELNAATLPNRNWINEHLTFTHGFGVTVGPVDDVTPEGLPQLVVQDIPPRSAAPELQVTQPEIYFGEMSNDRVYVNTRTAEFNHPAGEQNVFRSYTGEGGVSIGSTWRQLLYATRFADLKLLLSADLTPESRVLHTRNIRERLERVAPYLRFDNDPYMVIHEGRLVWVADAYTSTNRYPYSQPVGDINYIRNSVKAVVDAYHGHVRLYVADPTDPIIQTYGRIYPGSLRPLSEMPEGLRAHLRYPEDIFRVQSQAYATYHMDQPQAIYNQEDRWAVAAVPNPARRGETTPMEPYYTIMKLPGETREEFILMLPFTPQRKENLAAWMVARSDGENYGRLVVYRFPKQRLVFGPNQVIARINQDPEISRQLALWNQRGSQVNFGTLMVIPVKESLIYVQPLYLRAEAGRIPELRRVIVAADNRIAMEPTLEQSLARVFGGATESAATTADGTTERRDAGDQTTQATAPPPVSGDLTGQAREHYRRAVEAQRAGDWARYGDEINRLGAVLEQMDRQR